MCQKLSPTADVSVTRFAYVGPSQWERKEAPPEGYLEVCLKYPESLCSDSLEQCFSSYCSKYKEEDY